MDAGRFCCPWPEERYPKGSILVGFFAFLTKLYITVLTLIVDIKPIEARV